MRFAGGITRSGKAFSPYEIVIGEPITAPPNFNTGVSTFEREVELLHQGMESDHEVGDVDDLGSWVASLPPPLILKNAATAKLDTPSTTGCLPDTRTKNQKSRDKKKNRRRVERAAAAAESGSALKRCAKNHRRHAAATSIKPDIDYERHVKRMRTKPCWTALREKEQERQIYDLAGLQKLGMNLIDWNGR
jgi:hypothetical protein